MTLSYCFLSFLRFILFFQNSCPRARDTEQGTIDISFLSSTGIGVNDSSLGRAFLGECWR